MSTTQQQLEAWQATLFDLSPRNRLLHCRFARPGEPAGGDLAVRLLSPTPGDLFDRLVRQRQQLPWATGAADELLAAGELPAAMSGNSLEPDLPMTGTPAPADILVSELDPDELAYTLADLRGRERTARSEHGIDVLCVALGFLRWIDPHLPEQPLRSPLLLLPVELRYDTPDSEYALRLRDDQIRVNPLLAHQLLWAYGLMLPDLPENSAALEPERFFDQVAGLVFDYTGWQVLSDAALGLFAFQQMLLYQDLQYAAAQPVPHPLLALLAGEAPPPTLPEAVPPDTLDPAECYQILAADAEQQAAIAAARAGADFVLQGPPGTGKSQTIANIIATCLADGRRVLFVSEKQAALQEVYARLQQAGLADFCLALYGATAGRSALLETLTALTDPPELPPEGDFPYAEFAATRDQLNAYAQALHTPPGPLGLTAYTVYARLAGLQDAPTCDIAVDDATAYTPEQMEEINALLRQLDSRRALLETLPGNPWYGCAVTVGSFSERGRIRNDLRTLSLAIRDLPLAAARIADQLGLPAPTSLSETRALVHLIELLRAPHALSLWLDKDLTYVQYLQFDIADARQRYTSMADLEAQIRQRYTIGATESKSDGPATATPPENTNDQPVTTEEVNGQSVNPIAPETRLTPEKSGLQLDPEGHMLERFEQRYRGWTRLLRPGYYRDMAALRARLRPRRPLTYSRALADLRLVGALRAAQQHLEEIIPGLVVRSGRFFAGRRTDWENYEAACEWTLHVLMLPFPHPLPEQLRRLADLPPAERAALLAPAAQLSTAMTAFEGELAVFQTLFPPPATLTDSFAELLDEEQPLPDDAGIRPAKSPAILLERMTELDGWWEFCELRRRAAALGIAPYLDALSQGDPARAAPRRAFQRQFYQCWIATAHTQFPVLRDFQRDAHEALITRFRELDRAYLTATRNRLRRMLLTRRQEILSAAQYADALADLRVEAAQAPGHTSVRRLLRRLGPLLGQLTPCLLMSPLAVSQLLEPDIAPFDLVIFDEASQLRLETALGAIMRSRTLIVAGDQQQLAPTNLFAAGATGDLYSAEEAERPEALTSLLEAALAAGMPTLQLRRHYRSRHEALFAFANLYFYEGQLATVPTANPPDTYGVTFEHVPEGSYDRRGTHTNQVEAERVADLVCSHVRATPERSLGVVTFNQPQQQAIMQMLEQRYATDATLAPLFAETGREPFFVKDLEHVQGDARDVILISVGYGRDPRGNLMMHFGALNQQGGERRLNVAITRAREQVCLVSSLLPEEIDLGRARYPGPRLLRAYLEYVQQGGTATLRTPRERPQAVSWQMLYDAMISPPEEDFPRIEDTLAEELARNGLQIERQVGHSDMRIDIAIADPTTPGRYLLGITSDGNDYHAAPTARDRDRLPEELLAAHGWQIWRIWSAAWLADAEAELSRILDIITRPDDDQPVADETMD
ncbi:MAG: DUF4011 domain-containing protein [Chloroflexaceae bacterium]